jgi:pyochelin biosynthetic protein PchC
MILEPLRPVHSTWLRCYLPRPYARHRLVCLPHAGGTASFFRAWAADLPDHIELHAVQYPGREDRYAEACVTDLNRLAAHVAGAVTPLSDRPVSLFGHSMGAVVAHETARLLHERRRPPAHLFVSGHRAPCHHRPGTVHRGSDAALVEELARLGGTPPYALEDPELLSLILPAVRADYRALETHRPGSGPVLACPVTAFTGTDDPDVTVPEAGDWAACTSGPFTLRALPGDHFFLTGQRAAVITQVMRQLGGGGFDLP